jgi:hypothetical protein
VLLGLGVVDAVDGLDLGTVEHAVAVEVVQGEGAAEVEGAEVPAAPEGPPCFLFSAMRFASSWTSVTFLEVFV